MRVLTLTSQYPPHHHGGYELTCRDVMERFRAAGHDVTVLTSDARVPTVADADPPHVLRELVAYWDWEQGGPRGPRSPLARWRLDRHNLGVLRRVLADTSPDVVSAWHVPGVSMSVLGEVEAVGLPLVVTVANDWLQYGAAIDPWLRLWRRWPLPVPRRVGGVPTRPPTLARATVNYVSAHLRDRAGPVEGPVVHPGIEVADFAPSPAGEREWRWRVLYVGRLHPTKGVETLLRSFATLPSGTLEIVGPDSGGYESRLRALAADLDVGHRVQFNRVRRSALAERYRAADVVVFPSEWQEPFGLVPLEAMACAVPVVATGAGGSAEYLRAEENCLLFRAGDPAELVRALHRLAAEPALRQRLTAAGLRTALELNADRYATELLALHEQTVVTRSP